MEREKGENECEESHQPRWEGEGSFNPENLLKERECRRRKMSESVWYNKCQFKVINQICAISDPRTLIVLDHFNRPLLHNALGLLIQLDYLSNNFLPCSSLVEALVMLIRLSILLAQEPSLCRLDLSIIVSWCEVKCLISILWAIVFTKKPNLDGKNKSPCVEAIRKWSQDSP